MPLHYGTLRVQTENPLKSCKEVATINGSSYVTSVGCRPSKRDSTQLSLSQINYMCTRRVNHRLLQSPEAFVPNVKRTSNLRFGICCSSWRGDKSSAGQYLQLKLSYSFIQSKIVRSKVRKCLVIGPPNRCPMTREGVGVNAPLMNSLGTTLQSFIAKATHIPMLVCSCSKSYNLPLLVKFKKIHS